MSFVPTDPIDPTASLAKPSPFVVFTEHAIPATFDQSLSYQQALYALNDFIQKQVVPVINENAHITEQQTKVIEELQDYVNHYFDNLDVQEEINNKLDEMAEDGTLASIIAEYIQLGAILVYDTVADLKNAENLINTSTVRTLGYHAKGDGGGAIYKVRLVTNQDTENDVDIIALHDETLVAELICKEVNLSVFACYGDGTHDDTNAIKYAITYALENNLPITSPQDKTYLISETLKPRSAVIDLNNAKIITETEIDLFTWDQDEFLGSISNITLDCNDVASSALRFDYGHDCNINNIKIMNVTDHAIKLNYGTNNEHSWNLHFNNIYVRGGSDAENSVGILLNTSDCTFYNITMVNINVNYDSTNPTYNDISYSHCYNLDNDIARTSVMFRTSREVRWVTSHICCDSIHTFFQFTGNNASIQPFFKVDGLYVLYPDSVFTAGNDFTDSIIIDAPYDSNSTRISIQNGIIQGQLYATSGVHTLMMPSSSNTFLGNMQGTEYYNLENIGRKVGITVNSSFTEQENLLIYKDGGIVNMRLVIDIPSASLNQQYVNIGTIPTAFIPHQRIFATGVMCEDKYCDDPTKPSINASCYIDPSDGSIKIATPAVGTNPQSNSFKLEITYFIY